MCIRAAGQPYRITVEKDGQTESGLILWKALGKPNEIYHKSSMGLGYQLGEWVYDQKAVKGSHTTAIHLLPTREAAIDLAVNSYGEHLVACIVKDTEYWKERYSSDNKY